MDPDLYRRAKETFLSLCERPRNEWEAALAQLGCTDESLRVEVERLLIADDRSRGWEDPPLWDSSTSGGGAGGSSAAAVRDIAAAAREQAELDARAEIDTETSALPDQIGAYEIVRRIGEGGMGVVYEAEQSSPRRRVAVKLLRRGLSTKKLRRRFELEAEVLGQLHHDGIARIYEADVDKEGVPFIAMEYVDGVPLTHYLSQQELPLEARIELLATIADTVDHAHRKGILHRDIKPSNVLVQNNGAAKVLDFGVARAIDPKPDATVQTESGQLVGTLPYMSPEQAAGQPDLLDVRSDVYALGVLAYESLCGELPYPVLGKTLFEAVRIICEVEAKPLSTVDRNCRGDIETVIAKALSKDAERRYASAAELAADLRRTLRDEPIIARPPSAIYQFQKFARRNRALVTALAIAVFALTVGAVGVVLALDKALDANDEAERQGRIAHEVNEFLNNDLLGAAADPFRTGSEVRLYEGLQIATERLEGRFLDEPLIEARIRYSIGRGYLRLSRFDEAEAQLQRAAEIFATEAPDSEPDRSNWNAIGEVLTRTGRYHEAVVVYLENEARVERAGEAVPLSYKHNLAEAYRRQGRFAESAALHAQVVSAGIEKWGADGPILEIARTSYAFNLLDLDRRDEAEVIMREVVAQREAALGLDDASTYVAQNNLATILMGSKNEEAAELLEGVIGPMTELLGERHLHCVSIAGNLATTYSNLRRYDEAERLARRNLEIATETFGEQHPSVPSNQCTIAGVLLKTKRIDEALVFAEQSLRNREATLGPDHSATLLSVGYLARSYAAGKQYETAAQLFQRRLTGLQKIHQPGHIRITRCARRYADALRSLKDYDAEVPLRELVDAGQRFRNRKPTDIYRGRLDLANAYRRAGRPQDAIEVFQLLTRDVPEEYSATHKFVRAAYLGRARTLTALERHADAFATRHTLLGLERQVREESSSQMWAVMRATARAADRAGNFEVAEDLFDEELELRRVHAGANTSKTLAASRGIAKEHILRGRFAKAEELIAVTIDEARTVGDENSSQVLRGRGERIRLRIAQGSYEDAVKIGEDVYQRFVDTNGVGKSTRTIAKFLAEAFSGLDNDSAAAHWRALAEPPPDTNE
ncbi:MAG: serine/threonine-protein kinase [Planctomycetota bacterium]